MAASLSDLVNNLAKGLYKIKCQHCDWIWKCQG